VSGSWFGSRQQCGHRSSACCLDGPINETNWQSSLWESSCRSSAHNWKYISRPSRQQTTRVFTDPFTIQWNNAVCNNMPSYTYKFVYLYTKVYVFSIAVLIQIIYVFYNFAIDIEIVVNQIKLFIYLFSLFIYFKNSRKKII